MENTLVEVVMEITHACQTTKSRGKMPFCYGGYCK